MEPDDKVNPSIAARDAAQRLLTRREHSRRELLAKLKIRGFDSSLAYSVIDEQRDPLFRSRPCSVIRKGDWKLHQYFEDGGLELYNLKDDIGETNNVVEKQSDKAQELLTELESWQEKINAAIPIEKNPAFDSDAEEKAIKQALKRKKENSK